jgi:hypothetical protein
MLVAAGRVSGLNELACRVFVRWNWSGVEVKPSYNVHLHVFLGYSLRDVDHSQKGRVVLLVGCIAIGG